MKFVLIFGVATTLHIVHRSLSYNATSKLKTQVFHTPTQVQCLSDILDTIVFSPNIPFKLTGKAFTMLIDIFLCYDFSVNSFLQSYKVCLWNHFYKQNEKLICCNSKNIKLKLSSLAKTDLQQLRELPSLKKYLQESQKDEVNDVELKKILQDLLNNFHTYLKNFFIILKCLFKISSNLPSTPFGKHFREIYSSAVSSCNICETSEYKRVIQLLGMFGKEELLLNIKSIITILDRDMEEKDIVEKLKYYMNTLKNANLEVIELSTITYTPTQTVSRTLWREEMKKKSSQKNFSEYKEAVSEFVKFIDTQFFALFLKNPSQIPLNEIFCYNNRNEINSYVRGSMKSTIHKALIEPQKFIGCKCCISDNSTLSTYPDISLVYKIYLESGKMINLYDWLQGYLSFHNTNDEDDEQNVDPLLQARFTRAVAELQLLGYIKSTRKKTDHVKRLT